MAEAAVGEDLHQEDATVNALGVRAARLLGKEDALFVPTGTMGNLVSMWVHAQPGEEVILEEQSHIYNGELAGMSALCGLLARPIRGCRNGALNWADVRRHIRPEGRSPTRLVTIENTHNLAGGTIPDFEATAELCREARQAGLRTHLDGARLANAAVASGCTMAELASGFDSVMIDFAKGLAAPAGAIVAGDGSFVARARAARKLLGGAIHKPGMLAAACLYGLDHMLPTLAFDHEKARRLAMALAAMPGFEVAPERVVTNIVIVRLGMGLDGAGISVALRQRGILVNPTDDGRLRFVTHCGLTEEDIDMAIRAIREAV
jgi:threonine aldolase